MKKTHLQLYRIRMMALSRKHGHRMMEDIAPALNSLVQPARLMLLLIDGNRECLPATIIDGINERDVELVRMLREVVRAGHSCRILSVVSFVLSCRSWFVWCLSVDNSV